METGRSLAIIKPEVASLGRDSRRAFEEAFYRLAGNRILSETALVLTPEQTEALWRNSVSEYSWSAEYFNHMAQRVYLFALAGKQAASELKLHLRRDFATEIEELSQGSHFSLDLIHGSDPDEGENEIEILGISE